MRRETEKDIGGFFYHEVVVKALCLLPPLLDFNFLFLGMPCQLID